MKMKLDEHTIFKLTVLVTPFISIAGALRDGSVGVGFLLGGLIGALSFRLLAVDTTRLLQSPASNLSNRVMRSYLRRYLLQGLTLAIAILRPWISFWATLLGLLLPKLIIYTLLLTRRKKHNAI